MDDEPVRNWQEWADKYSEAAAEHERFRRLARSALDHCKRERYLAAERDLMEAFRGD